MFSFTPIIFGNCNILKITLNLYNYKFSMDEGIGSGFGSWVRLLRSPLLPVPLRCGCRTVHSKVSPIHQLVHVPSCLNQSQHFSTPCSFYPFCIFFFPLRRRRNRYGTPGTTPLQHKSDTRMAEGVLRVQTLQQFLLPFQFNRLELATTSVLLGQGVYDWLLQIALMPISANPLCENHS